MPGKLSRATVITDFALIKNEKPFQDLIDKYFRSI